MNLQRGDATHDWRLPCGHHKVRVQPSLGDRQRRCDTCRAYFTVTVVPARLNVGWVSVDITPQEKP